MHQLAGKTIVITGASSGIGEAAAYELAKRGVHVCLVARRADELDRVRSRIVAAGGAASAYPADLSRPEEVDACADAILAAHPRVEGLVNNAGRSIRRAIVDSLDRAHDYERTMQINYFAAVRMTLKLVPRFLEQGEGHIVNSSSLSTQVPIPRYSAYLASKAALDSFSRSIAAELEHRGVTVTTLHYPLVYTPMATRTGYYRGVRMMKSDEAAGWVVEAFEARPARIGRFVGTISSVLMAAMPGPMTRLAQPVFRAADKRMRRRAAKAG